MIDLATADFLLQWAAGGMFFCWVTTRRREVSIGYGWTIRGTYLVIAVLGLGAGLAFGVNPVRELSAAALAVVAAVGLAQSWIRRHAGVSGQRMVAETRSARIAKMTGIDRSLTTKQPGSEFDPRLDLLAAAVALPGIVAAGIAAGDSPALLVARMILGALFLGAVTDAMLLGHWYLVQPGMSREPLNELVRWTAILWLPHTVVFLLPTGMVSALNGSIEDGYDGMLGYFWVGCVVATIVLVFVTMAALRERQYSAVMAATGLLYLAILTAFGMDLVARAILAIGESA
ncbi:MAG: hypothetical protein HKN24_06130 [Acidimicrobiales bacterium]|nr:hypothetical protein [Acidimicrobiales bacterium]